MTHRANFDHQTFFTEGSCLKISYPVLRGLAFNPIKKPLSKGLADV